MRILADIHISPRTVEFLQSLGHDAIRINSVMSASAPDEAIVTWAIQDNRVILTQDLDFSAIIALSGRNTPSLITLRLSSSQVDHVNAILKNALPRIEDDITEGLIVTINERRIRLRRLPI